MDSVDKLEKVVEQMSHEERNRFREWFAAFDAAASLRLRLQHAQQEVAAAAAQLTDAKRPSAEKTDEHSARALPSDFPPSVVDKAKWQAPQEWVAAFERYTAGNQNITAVVVDDSRESIYAGRGE